MNPPTTAAAGEGPQARQGRGLPQAQVIASMRDGAGSVRYRRGAMWLVAIALPVGIFAGLLAGGQWAHVVWTRARWWSLAGIGLVLSAVLGVWRDPPLGSLLVAAMLVVFLAFAVGNLHLVGMSVVTIGIGLNLIPLAVNGSIPVRPEAVVQAGLATAENYELVQPGAGRHLEDDDDRLVALGAVVPLKFVKEVFSFGDLIVMAGLINVGFRAARPHHRRRFVEQTGDDVADQQYVGFEDLAPAPGAVPTLEDLAPQAARPSTPAPDDTQWIGTVTPSTPPAAPAVPVAPQPTAFAPPSAERT